MVYFLFGKMLSLLWQIRDIAGLIVSVANTQILKNNLTIWSPCRLTPIANFSRVDPWANFDLNGLVPEKATRHRYNAMTKTWTLDEVLVKIDRTAFDKGAMRECFRM